MVFKFESPSQAAEAVSAIILVHQAVHHAGLLSIAKKYHHDDPSPTRSLSRSTPYLKSAAASSPSVVMLSAVST